jgi:hypothetical protein
MVAWVVAAIFSVKHFDFIFCMACLIFNKIILVLGKRYTASSNLIQSGPTLSSP